MNYTKLKKEELIKNIKLLETKISKLDEIKNPLNSSTHISCQKLFDLSPNGILIEDKNGNIIDINPALCKVLGYKKNELIGKNIAILAEQNSQKDISDNITEILSGKNLSHETKNICKDGSICYLRLNETKIILPNGEDGILCISDNITKRKIDGEVLKASYELYQKLLENSPTGIFYADTTGQILEINSKMLQILDSPSAEATKNINILTFPNLVEAGISEDIINSIKTEQTVHGEKKYHTKWNKNVFLNYFITPIKDTTDKVTGVLINVEDITNQKEAEENLQYTRARFKSLAEAAFEGIVFSKQGFIIEVNDQFANMLGFQRDELIGIHVTDFILPKYHDKVKDAIKTNNLEPYEIELRRKDGSEFFAEVRARLSHTEVGQIRVTAVRDITSYKKFEATILESEKKFREIVEQTYDAICIYDIKTGEILDSNKIYQRLLGYTANELKSLTIYDLVAHSKESIDFFINEIKVKKSYVVGERKHKRKDGVIVDVEVSVLVINYFGKEAMCVFIRDISERIESEKILRKSEERYKAFINQSTEGIWRIEFDKPIPTYLSAQEQLNLIFNYGYIAECNNAFAKMYDTDTCEELIGTKLCDLIIRNDENNIKNFTKFIQNDYKLNIIKSHDKDKNGNERYFIKNLIGIVENGNLIRAWGMQRDITESTKTNEALKTSELQFRQVWNHSFDGMRLINAKGEIVLVNDAFCKITEKKREELIGKPFTHIYDSKRQESMFATGIERIKELRVQDNFEKQLVLWNGKKIWFELSNSFIDIGTGEILLLSIFRDITERKAAEEKLIISENSYRGLFNSVIDAIYILDSNSLFIDVNDGALLMYGYERDEFIGRTPEFLSADGMNDIEDTVNKINKAFNGELQRFEWWGRRKNGQIFPKEVVLIKGSYFGKDVVIATGRDITERKADEKKLKDFTEELKQLNYNKDKFFSIVAHDLKSPFQGLLGYSELLLDDFDILTDTERKEYVKNINSITRNVFNLVENLLEWSRIQTGRKEYQPIKINLYDFTQEVINILIGSAIKKNISIINDVLKHNYVNADAKMLNSILQNLIYNGIKFSMPGGEIKITSRQIDNFIEIRVSDNGIGIKEEDKEKLFRIDINHTSKGTSKEQGTGLGLILCKELIEKHGGKIFIESQFGKGSNFIFTLPSI
jgi:PAS domain S-box-containing protein